MYKKNNSNVLRIIVFGLVVVLCLSLFTDVFSKKDDDYSKTRMSWTVGGLDETYKIDKEVENQMLSDREEIGKGLKISPDFNKGVSYSVIFYDDLDNFVGEAELPGGETVFTNIYEKTLEEIQADFAEATYFRVLLTPDDKDSEITKLEKLKYAKHIAVYELDK